MKKTLTNLFIILSFSLMYFSSFSQIVSLEGIWLFKGGNNNQICKITQNGNNLTLINERGEQSLGTIIDNQYIIATSWGNLRGNLSQNNNLINWTNSTSWHRESYNLDLGGIWYHRKENKECRIIQNKNNLVFINENGGRSEGFINSENTVIAFDWGNLKANLSADKHRLNWLGGGGGYWYRYPDIEGVWYKGEKSANNICKITQNENRVVLTNELGQKSNGIINDIYYIRATDWGNLRGIIYIDNKRITWENGTNWVQ